MRAPALVVLVVAVTSWSRANAQPAPGAAAAPTAVAGRTVASEQAAESSIRYQYIKPKDPKHEPLYREVQERRVLEKMAEVLGAVRLPRTLTLQFKGCDGDSNAYYADDTTSVTFCYEFLSDIVNAAKKGVRKAPKGAKLTVADATDGPAIFFMLHESGHAVFDLLKVPIMGKEEDAADAFASLVILRMGPEFSLRLLRGTAWAFAHDAKSRKLDESDFADIHGLDSQRYFNLLCIAYGSDKATFADAIKVGKLPPERATWCGLEFKQARYAIQKLILPAVDQEQFEYVRMKYARPTSKQ